MASGFYPLHLYDNTGKLLKGAITLIEKALKPSPYGREYAECPEDSYSDGWTEGGIRLAVQLLLEAFYSDDREKIISELKERGIRC